MGLGVLGLRVQGFRVLGQLDFGFRVDRVEDQLRCRGCDALEFLVLWDLWVASSRHRRFSRGWSSFKFGDLCLGAWTAFDCGASLVHSGENLMVWCFRARGLDHESPKP